jgi:hypothetical protein
MQIGGEDIEKYVCEYGVEKKKPLKRHKSKNTPFCAYW